jgi:hypothetical protein
MSQTSDKNEILYLYHQRDKDQKSYIFGCENTSLFKVKQQEKWHISVIHGGCLLFGFSCTRCDA